MDNNISFEDLNVTLMENPPKKKRGRVNSLSKLNDFHSNESLLVAIQAMESRLSTKIDTLGNCLNTKIDLLAARLDVKIDKVESDLTAQISSLSTSVDNRFKEKASVSDLNNLQIDVTLLQNKQKHSESILDKIEREHLLNQLIISNIPYIEKEDLLNVCGKISNAIGCQVPIIAAYRLKTKLTSKEQFASALTADNNINASTSCTNNQPKGNIPKGNFPSIVVKFDSTENRFNFFHQYLSFKNLNIQHIGFKTASRIYINELLTKRNSEILQLVRKLKVHNKISRYYTSRGIVYVSKPDDKLKSFPILDKKDLTNLDI